MPDCEKTTAVPAEQTPALTRQCLLQPPDWRYSSALSFLESEASGDAPTIPCDTALQYLIRGLKTMRTRAGRRYIDGLWPAFSTAVKLGTTKRDSAITASIEACLITGTPVSDGLCADISGNLTAVVDLYSKFFFDLTGVTALNAWFDDYLFSTENHRKNSPVLRARLLAYYKGKDAGLKAAVNGPSSKAIQSFMKDIGENARQQKVFDYLVKAVNLDATTYATLMEAAVKSTSDREFQEHMRDREEAGSSTLEELAAHIEEGIRAYTQAERDHVSEDGSGVNLFIQPAQ